MFEFILYIVTGSIAGFLSGLLGIGGGLVIVPLLSWIFYYQDIPRDNVMQMAVGTSLLAMVVTTTLSFREHYRKEFDIVPILKMILPMIVLGTICGATIADFVNSDVVRVIFGLFVLIVCFRMFMAFEPNPFHHLPGRFGFSLVAFLIGSTSGLLGNAGGVFMVPYLTRCNVAIQKTLAVSAASGLVIALTGSVAYLITGTNELNMPSWSTGYVYWPAIFGIILTTPVFVHLGAKLSHRLPVKTLRRIFAICLLLVAIRMLTP